MKITLESLKIRFKGISFEIDLKGKNATISGENGTGKSTVADSFFWLISGKNSDMSATFNILPVAPDGNPIDHSESEVEAVIKIDKKKITLYKKHRQKWTKKRGSATETFTGNTTDHAIDGVPVAQNEFNDQLAKIIDDTLFRILSDVKFFCGAMKPDMRRQILIDLCGDVAPADIIAANPELAELDSILSEHDFESHRKILMSRRKKINKRIDEIPKLIAERRIDIAALANYDEIALRQQLDELDEKIKDGIRKLGELSTGNGGAELRKQQLELELSLDELEAETRRKNAEKVEAKESEKHVISKLIANLEINQNRDGVELKSIEKQIIELEAKKADLYNQWKKTNESHIEKEEICFNCGQALPTHMIANQLSNFNENKADKLRDINERGQNCANEIDQLSGRKQILLETIAKRDDNIAIQKGLIAEIDIKIHDINNSNNVEYGKKQAEINGKLKVVNDKIEALRDDVEPEKETLKTQISQLEDEKDVVDSRIREIAHSDKAKKRIAGFEAEQKELVKEFQNSEHQLWMIEEYGRRRAEYIESSVNQHFKFITWKLFQLQQNEGIRQICEPMLNGVPYSTDASTGEKIIMGLDCIATLSKHYDTWVPVFIDDGESLTDSIEAIEPKQWIRLEAKKDVKELKIEEM